MEAGRDGDKDEDRVSQSQLTEPLQTPRPQAGAVRACPLHGSGTEGT